MSLLNLDEFRRTPLARDPFPFAVVRKFVAAAACFDGEPWDILLKRGRNISRALALGTVLTLPATGSEMNSGAVVTRQATQTKLAFLENAVRLFGGSLWPTFCQGMVGSANAPCIDNRICRGASLGARPC